MRFCDDRLFCSIALKSLKEPAYLSGLNNILPLLQAEVASSPSATNESKKTSPQFFSCKNKEESEHNCLRTKEGCSLQEHFDFASKTLNACDELFASGRTALVDFPKSMIDTWTESMDVEGVKPRSEAWTALKGDVALTSTSTFSMSYLITSPQWPLTQLVQG